MLKPENIVLFTYFCGYKFEIQNYIFLPTFYLMTLFVEIVIMLFRTAQFVYGLSKIIWCLVVIARVSVIRWQTLWQYIVVMYIYYIFVHVYNDMKCSHELNAYT